MTLLLPLWQDDETSLYDDLLGPKWNYGIEFSDPFVHWT